jgi:hypothetical protein
MLRGGTASAAAAAPLPAAKQRLWPRACACAALRAARPAAPLSRASAAWARGGGACTCSSSSSGDDTASLPASRRHNPPPAAPLPESRRADARSEQARARARSTVRGSTRAAENTTRAR